MPREEPKTGNRLRCQRSKSALRPCPWPDRTRALDGIASAVVETFPGGSANRNITNEANGFVLEALADVDDVAVWSKVRFDVGALVRRIGDTFSSNDRRITIETGLSAEPLVALAFEVKAIGSEGKAIGANRTTSVIIAAHRPQGFVFVRLVSAEIDGSPGVQARVDSMKKNIVAETSITGNGIDTQGRIETRELAQ